MVPIRGQFRQYLTRSFFLGARAIEGHHRLLRDFGLSVAEFLEVVAYLEARYNVDLPNELLHPAITVGQLEDALESQLQRKQGSPSVCAPSKALSVCFIG